MSTAGIYLHAVPDTVKINFSLLEGSSLKEYLRGQLNLSKDLTPRRLEKLLLTKGISLIGLTIFKIEYRYGTMGFVSSDLATASWKSRPFSDISDLTIRLTGGSPGCPGSLPDRYWVPVAGRPIINLEPTAANPEYIPVSYRFEMEGLKSHRCYKIFVGPHLSMGQLKGALQSNLLQVSQGSLNSERCRIATLRLETVTADLPDDTLVRHCLGQLLVLKMVVYTPWETSSPAEPESPAVILEKLLSLQQTVTELKLEMEQLQVRLAGAQTKRDAAKTQLTARINELTQ